ncbi:MAG: molybdenum cofactor carrier [Alphaproteobacteria bacterium]|nr:MAG: molybdenum cofactor carrier [Alphaproteobacteria bacterium]
MKTVVEKIISGGQTGVDRAALDHALALDIPCGGWCPEGRRAEDGTLPAASPAPANRGARYRRAHRTQCRHSCATLLITRGLITRGPPDGGSRLTLAIAPALGRPHSVADLAPSADPGPVVGRLAGEGVRVLDVAGPRESSKPGIYAETSRFLGDLFRRLGAAVTDR